MSTRQPPRRPQRDGATLFTPGASAARRSLERASIGPAAFLRQMPTWLTPSAVAALFIVGVAVRGWAGAAALLVVTAFIGWLASLSWPAQGMPGRLLRVAVLAALLAFALWQASR